MDGGTRRDISTGIGFLNHMLSLMAFHGHFDLGVEVEGDLGVDDHHTVEDVGICLGKAIRQALIDSNDIERYSSTTTPMDEALVLVAIDVSGRGQVYFEPKFKRPTLGGMATENVKEFFKALAHHAGLTLHITVLAGENDHHMCEAIFKGFGRALHLATFRRERSGHTTSTKGAID